MGDKLTSCVCCAYFFILCGAAAHVVGFLTNHWFTASSDDSDTIVEEVNVGLWKQHIVYSNGTHTESDSPLNNKEEQYLILAIVGANVLMCFVVLIKAIHVCVGILSFIIMSLMLLSVFFLFENAKDSMEKLQYFRPEWPEMKLWWSFYLIFGGLVLNILATVTFLTIVLIKGEKKASLSSKGLGPEDHAVVVNDKAPIVIISGSEIYSYDNNGLNEETSSETVSPSYEALTFGNAAPDTNYMDLHFDSAKATKDADKLITNQTISNHSKDNHTVVDKSDEETDGNSNKHCAEINHEEIKYVTRGQDYDMVDVTESVTRL